MCKVRITYTTWRGKTDMPVAEFVEQELRASNYDTIEELRERSSNAISALARLLEVMAAKHAISPEELCYVLNANSERTDLKFE